MLKPKTELTLRVLSIVLERDGEIVPHDLIGELGISNEAVAQILSPLMANGYIQYGNGAGETISLTIGHDELRETPLIDIHFMHYMDRAFLYGDDFKDMPISSVMNI